MKFLISGSAFGKLEVSHSVLTILPNLAVRWCTLSIWVLESPGMSPVMESQAGICNFHIKIPFSPVFVWESLPKS